MKPCRAMWCSIRDDYAVGPLMQAFIPPKASKPVSSGGGMCWPVAIMLARSITGLVDDNAVVAELERTPAK